LRFLFFWRFLKAETVLSLIASTSYCTTRHSSLLYWQLFEQVKTIRLPQSNLSSF
jgi:hypothetical protein